MTISSYGLQVRKALEEKFKIPEEKIADLKMDVDDVNGELEKCKNYLTEAEKVLSTLEADIASETLKFGVKVVGATAGVAAAITVGGGMLIILLTTYKHSFAKTFHSINRLNIDCENTQHMINTTIDVFYIQEIS